MPSKPRLLAERATPSDRNTRFDLRNPSTFSDFASVFTIGPLWVIVELGDFGGRLKPIRIEVRGYAAPRDRSAYPITSATLRKLRVGELIKRSVNAQKNVAEFLAKQANLSAPSPEQLARFELERRRVLKAGRNRRPGSSPPRREEGAKFTEVMEALQRAAGSDQPNVDVGKELGLSRWTVAKYAQRGRELGMLPKVVRRPG